VGQDSDPATQEDRIGILSHEGDSAVKKLLVVCGMVLFAGCGGKSTDDWVQQLRSGDGSQRLHAIRALENRGTEAPVVVPALAEALRDENAFVRRDAAAALGKLGAEARPAVLALQAARKDRERSVRSAAGAALKKIDPAVP
jgi:HEAT repeat protein